MEFSSVRYVKAVATQGRWPEGFDLNWPQYVTSFLVWYSLDCSNFTCVTDVDGFNKVNTRMYYYAFLCKLRIIKKMISKKNELKDNKINSDSGAF